MSDDSSVWNAFAIICALVYACFFVFAAFCQIAVNWKHRLVVAMSFDWVSYNLLGYFSLLLYTSFMSFSSTTQDEFFDDHPDVDQVPVFYTDFLVACAGLFLTLVLVWQCFMYRRFSASIGEKKATRNSAVGLATVGCGWLALLVSSFVAALPSVEWWRLYDGVVFAGIIFVMVTFVRYIPQASVNFRRRSTQGWSKVLLVSEMMGAVFLTFEVFFSTADAGTDFYFGKYAKLLVVGAIFFWSTVIMIQHLTCCSEKALETSRKERVREQEYLQQRIMYDDYDNIKREALGDFRVLEDYDPHTDGRVSSSTGKRPTRREGRGSREGRASLASDHSSSSSVSPSPSSSAISRSASVGESPLSSLRSAAAAAGGAVIRVVAPSAVVNGNLEKANLESLALLEFPSDMESELDLGDSCSDFDLEGQQLTLGCEED
eukprot:CAMPEP_0114612540 /NCGR_PEP_ID=MMETSP0168-20121206/4674_1 /TAXON_ID=95228 ORGANISM="Vannella sp., Strain DIVA3 517/6/12" /NCGR_SAMPLE_ID=MMETSP0168 /ASSEMBLY_ACC=CAM_ASM_000044 /LENGTH=431 /DNA_ID=CAMNT_0001823527 /DNA_START=109 /DNA_END=1401 /DNA_ORIENTATION=+